MADIIKIMLKAINEKQESMPDDNTFLLKFFRQRLDTIDEIRFGSYVFPDDNDYYYWFEERSELAHLASEGDEVADIWEPYADEIKAWFVDSEGKPVLTEWRVIDDSSWTEWGWEPGYIVELVGLWEGN